MILKKKIIPNIFTFTILFFSISIGSAQINSKDSLLFQIKKIRENTSENTQTKAYVDLLNELAKKFRYRNADSIKLLSDEAFLIASKINYPIGKAFALLRRGDYYSDTGMEKKAYEVYKESKSLAYSSNYSTLKVEVLKSLAFQDFISQNLNNSVLTYYEAIDLASKNNLYELEARLRHNLGYGYSNYKLYDEALIEYLVADSLWNRVKVDSHLKAMTLSNIALNAIKKGDLEFGDHYNERSINLLIKKDEHLWLSRAYRVKARYHLKLNNYKKAEEWIIKSDSLLSKLYNPRDKMELNLIHSNILVKLGKLEDAKKYSQKTLKKSLEFKDSLFQVRAYNNLEKIEELKGQTDSAYDYHKKSVHIRSLLKEDNKVQNIVLLRAKMNFGIEKEALRLKNLKTTLKQQKYTQWITLALLTTLIITFIVYISHKREKRLNKQLHNKTSDLESREVQMRELNNTQEKLFSIVGHDLKGPISSLKELLQVMSKEENSEILLRGLLPKLNNYTEHMHFTLENLLNWGKNQMQGEHISPSILNLHTIGTGVLALFSEAITKKELKVDFVIAKETSIYADKEDVNVIFRNLLSNAIKFTHPKGTISITASTQENSVLIEFTDTGVGMSRETQKLVCDSQKHYSTFGTNNEKGTGLGLMLCKTLVARNNGEINVDSSEDKGTTFFVHLPSKPIKNDLD